MVEPGGLRPGLETGGYRIERLLGRGGMGQVWEATQLSLDRRVAIKVIADDVAAEVGFAERFRNEALMAARVNHEAVLPVFDHGTLDDGRLFLAMKLVEGPDLSMLLAERGSLPLREAVALLSPVAEALDAAHSGGLVHRDVKPSNVLLEPRKDGWRPYLADFGIAKARSANGAHTSTGSIVGTVDYMSPEQIRGDSGIDGRVDVYAFGCMLYRTVTGRHAYPRATEAATILAHLNEPPPVPSRVMAELPPAFDLVIRRAMDKDFDRRARSAGALMSWLAAELDPLAAASRTEPPLPDGRRFGFRARLLASVVLLAPAFVAAYLIGAKL